MHARGAETARLYRVGLRVRLAGDGGVCTDPGDRNVHPHAAAGAEKGQQVPAQARRAHRRPQPASSGDQEHCLPEVLEDGPKLVFSLRPPGDPLHRAQCSGPSQARDSQAVQLAISVARGHGARDRAGDVPAGQRWFCSSVPAGERGGSWGSGRERADCLLLSEPRRSRVHHRCLHVHAHHRLPGRQDHHPVDVQRASCPPAGRGSLPLLVHPWGGDAAKDFDGGQVPGAAERLHPAVSGAHQDCRTLARREEADCGSVASSSGSVRVLSASSLQQLHRAGPCLQPTQPQVLQT
mmetsp:Transcript_33132/g.104779  ORF Transcript_33132/g.104779 Transcript_33132/m.104779 type:complete len:294 (-) Transcript_33132:731-1612(-)